jgi:hypothetical protein
MKTEGCVSCGRVLRVAENINESGDRSVVIYTFAQTRGFRPLTRSSARRRTFCVPCATARGFAPCPDGAFNEDVYRELREILEKNPGLKDAAWEESFTPHTRPRLMPGSKPDSSLTPKELPSPFKEAS